MQRFPCLFLCLSLLATSACSADAIAGLEVAAPAPAAAAELEAALQAEKAAPAAPESSPRRTILYCRATLSPQSTEPLYIIDGTILPHGDARAQVDPNDIESIEVIKGAPAAAIYGSRAARGVIIITTRNPRPQPAGG